MCSTIAIELSALKLQFQPNFALEKSCFAYMFWNRERLHVLNHGLGDTERSQRDGLAFVVPQIVVQTMIPIWLQHKRFPVLVFSVLLAAGPRPPV